MSPTEARLWGPLVRIGHWAAALAMLVAVLTAGRPLGLHTRAGYALLAYVLARAVWSAFGPARARLWSAVGGPAAILAELRAVVTRQPERPPGLGPVGALLVVAMLAGIVLTGLTGVATLAVREGQGPLAFALGGFYEAPPEEIQVRKDLPPTDPEVGGTTIISRTDRVPSATPTGEHPDIRSGSGLKAVHGFFSSLTVWLAVTHVVWVLLASMVRGENLILSMVTGARHATPPQGASLASIIKATPRPEPPAAATEDGGASAGSERAARKAARAERGGGRRGERRGGGGGRRRREAG